MLKRGDIQGLKLDDSGNILEGAVIGLFSSDTEEFTKETALMTTVSGSDGVFSFNDIPVGSYIVKELESPANYLLDTNNYPVELTDDKQVVKLEITNVLKRGNIQGVKVDNNGKALEGAVIALFPADAAEFTEKNALEITKSDKDGKFSFLSIPVGEYIVKELEAPEGYILDDKNYEISITENDQTIEIEIVNTMKIGRLTLTHNYLTSPKTGADYIMIAVTLAGTSAIIITIIYIIAKRRKVKE